MRARGPGGDGRSVHRRVKVCSVEHPDSDSFVN